MPLFTPRYPVEDRFDELGYVPKKKYEYPKDYVCDLNDFDFTLKLDDTYEIDGFVDSNHPAIIIPSTYNNKPVTSMNCIVNDNSTIEAIFIPKSIINIGGGYWRGRVLNRIIVEEGNPRYDSRNNCNAIIESETNTLIKGCSNTIIPDSVVKIGESAFCECGFKYMYIPDSVKNISDSAFVYCDNLMHITLGKNLETIGVAAFEGCEHLYSIYNKSELDIKLPRDNAEAEEKEAFGRVAENAYSVYKNIYDEAQNRISFTNGFVIFHIINAGEVDRADPGQHIAIYYFGKLKECIELPNGTTDIGQKDFENQELFKENSLVEALVIPGSVIKICDNVYNKCKKLKQIIFLGNLEDFAVRMVFGELGKINGLTIECQDAIIQYK